MVAHVASRPGPWSLSRGGAALAAAAAVLALLLSGASAGAAGGAGVGGESRPATLGAASSRGAGEAARRPLPGAIAALQLRHSSWARGGASAGGAGDPAALRPLELTDAAAGGEREARRGSSPWLAAGGRGALAAPAPTGDWRYRRALLRNETFSLRGAVREYGYFTASLYLGTPPRRYELIVDTGSTMTYVPCADCGDGCGPNHADLAFDPSASSTAEPLGCDAEGCECGVPTCGCDSGQCTYLRTYAERSMSQGVLIRDVLTLHDGLPPAPVVFGCEHRETGEIYKQRADGLLGLGNSKAALLNQLVAAGQADGVFSLCFGGIAGDGALLFGNVTRATGTDGEAASPGAPASGPSPPLKMLRTPMRAPQGHPYFYGATLLDLRVADVSIGIKTATYAKGYGAVLDSGTTFAYLPTPAYGAIVRTVRDVAVANGLSQVPGPDPSFTDICFGGADPDGDPDLLAQVFPTLTLAFAPEEGAPASSALLTVNPVSYLFVHTRGSGKYCLGVFDNGQSGTLLGGILFRNVLVEYDVARSRLGFAQGVACARLGDALKPRCSDMFAAESEGGGPASPSAGSPNSTYATLVELAEAEGDCRADDAEMERWWPESPGSDDTPGESEAAESAARNRREFTLLALLGGVLLIMLGSFGFVLAQSSARARIARALFGWGSRDAPRPAIRPGASASEGERQSLVADTSDPGGYKASDAADLEEGGPNVPPAPSAGDVAMTALRPARDADRAAPLDPADGEVGRGEGLSAGDPGQGRLGPSATIPATPAIPALPTLAPIAEISNEGAEEAASARNPPGA